jgi:hypothetical protein
MSAATCGHLRSVGVIMGIVLASESVFPLAESPRHVPARRGGKRLHQSTAFRWAKHGLRGVRLETIRVGGTLCTSAEALQRFFDALSAAPVGHVATGRAAAVTTAGRSAETAGLELRRRGF